MNTVWKKIGLIWFILLVLLGGFFLIYKTSHNYIATIVIDPGHGGYDPGALSLDESTYEKDVTMKIAYKIGQQITKLDSSIQVKFTRIDDDLSWPENEMEDLLARVDIAQQASADYFLSIHLNSSENSSSAGYEGFVKESDLFSQEVYQKINEGLESKGYSYNRGLFTDRSLLVVDQLDIPSLLLEVGFISNPSELSELENPLIQNKIAQVIAQAYVDQIHKEKSSNT